MHDKLGMTSLVDRLVTSWGVASDIDVFPMALGGLTTGVTPLEMAGAYQIYANGGYYTEPYAYTQVLDADGDVLLTRDTTPRRVISPETATIVNRLMQRVTTGPYGTGGAAPFNQASYPVAGKTGTTDDDKDQWFMGITPYYVTACLLYTSRSAAIPIKASGPSRRSSPTLFWIRRLQFMAARQRGAIWS